MSDATGFLFHFLSGAFEIYFLIACFNIFLQPRFTDVRHKIFQILSTAIYPIAAYIIIIATDITSPIFPLIAMGLFVVFYSKIFYKNKVFDFSTPSAPSIAIVYYACTIMFSAITASLAVFMSAGDVTIATVGHEFELSHFALDMLIVRIPIATLYLIIKKRTKGRQTLKTPYFLYIVCASAIVLITILFPLYLSLAYGEGLLYSVTFLSATFIIGILVFVVLSTAYHRITLRGQQAQLDIIRIRNELLSQNLNDAKHLHQERSKLAHDMKEHLSILYNLAKEEGNQKLCAYIETIHSPLKDIVRIENTGNEFLDTILTVKKQQALKQGVPMDIDCNITPPLNIDPIDLTAILSNLLQNALEACEKVEDCNERYIYAAIQSQGAFLNIKIENSANSKLIKRNKEMRTTKKDKRMHGIGLQSVHSSVKRYQGDIIFESSDNLFTVSVVLCLST